MLYFLYGGNSLFASKKIQEIKKAFFKKNPNFLLEELDGNDENITYYDFLKFIENPSLFSQKRLIVFRNLLSKIPSTEKFIAQNIDFLKDSNDIFLLWESDIKENGKIFEMLKKNSAKSQEVKEISKNIFVTKDNYIFRVVDKIFASRGTHVLLCLEEAKNKNVDSKSLVNVIFWKIKKMTHKNKHALDIAHNAILTDLNLKIDSKNEYEHLSRFAIGVTSKF